MPAEVFCSDVEGRENDSVLSVDRYFFNTDLTGHLDALLIVIISWVLIQRLFAGSA